jgi:hypothetical protein
MHALPDHSPICASVLLLLERHSLLLQLCLPLQQYMHAESAMHMYSLTHNGCCWCSCCCMWLAIARTSSNQLALGEELVCCATDERSWTYQALHAIY